MTAGDFGLNYFDLQGWRATEARISKELGPTFAAKDTARLWRVINASIHILYSACAQHGVAESCSHTDDEHLLMWLGGRMLTNTLAAVQLLVVGYYGPALAQVRDSIETTMLLALFEAAPEELATWRTSSERWKFFSPGEVRKKLNKLKVWHRYEDYDLYTGMAGHPTPKTARMFFSDMRQRRMVGPFADTDNAKETLHHVALAAAHGAYQMADILKVQERLAAELEELNNAMDEYGTASNE